MRLYLAGPLSTRDEVRSLAAILRNAGHAIVSTWHDIDGATVDPHTHEERAAIAAACVSEVLRADASGNGAQMSIFGTVTS